MGVFYGTKRKFRVELEHDLKLKAFYETKLIKVELGLDVNLEIF